MNFFLIHVFMLLIYLLIIVFSYYYFLIYLFIKSIYNDIKHFNLLLNIDCIVLKIKNVKF